MESIDAPNTQKEFFLFALLGMHMLGNYLSTELQAYLQNLCVRECPQRPEVGVGGLP